jgi:hypothetical protein
LRLFVDASFNVLVQLKERLKRLSVCQVKVLRGFNASLAKMCADKGITIM